MTYTPTTWVDEVTDVTADRMNVIEQGIADAHAELPWSPVAATQSTNVDLTAPTLNLDGGASLPAYNPRVLLLGQTNPAENGLYEFTSGFVGNTMARVADANQGTEFRQGREVYVIAGPYADQRLVYVGPDNPNLGVDPITFHAPAAAGSKAFAFLMG